jgi:hypothetical protein
LEVRFRRNGHPPFPKRERENSPERHPRGKISKNPDRDFDPGFSLITAVIPSEAKNLGLVWRQFWRQAEMVRSARHDKAISTDLKIRHHNR